MSGPVETIQVQPDEAGLRLDRWFKIHFPYVTYGYLQKLLRSGQVRVDSKRRVTDFRLTAYSTPRGNAAAYYPETNPLVPLDHVADTSNTPVSKAITIRLEPHA